MTFVRRTPPEYSADEAVQLIKSGDRVYLHEAAMIPHELIEALVRRHPISAMSKQFRCIPTARRHMRRRKWRGTFGIMRCLLDQMCEPR